MMVKNSFICGILYGICLTFLCNISGQAEKKSLEIDAYKRWKRVESPNISFSGRWVTYHITPQDYNQKSEKKLYLYDTQKKQYDSIPNIDQVIFLYNDRYLMYETSDTTGNTHTMLMSLKNKKTREWQYIEPLSPVGQTVFSASTIYIPEDSVKRTPQFNRLIIRNIETGDSLHIDSIKSYNFYNHNKSIIFIQKHQQGNQILYGPIAGPYKVLYQGNEKYPEHFNFSEKTLTGSFNIGEDSLWYNFSLKNKKYNLLLDKKEIPVPAGMEIHKLNLANNKKYFTLELKPITTNKQNTVNKKKNKNSDSSFELELWTWNEYEVPTTQRKSRYNKQEYDKYIYIPENKRLVMVAPAKFDVYYPYDCDDIRFVISTDDGPYLKDKEWVDDTPFDIYLTDLSTGKRQLVGTKYRKRPEWGPKGKYAVMYDPITHIWNKIDGTTGKVSDISTATGDQMYYKLYDKPAPAPSYGIAGWMADGNSVLLYGEYDWWKIDLTGKDMPECFTQEYGRKNKMSIRKITSNFDTKVFSPNENILVKLFNHITKEEGIYSLNENGKLKKLTYGPYQYSIHKISENKKYCIWVRQNIDEFRDLWWSKIDFSNPTRITNANPQQSEYKWGTVKVVKWTNYEGKENEGLLYLPENYDSTKKYPTLVQFYETHSNDAYVYRTPGLSSAMADIITFVSNGYIVFTPDIHFTIGMPGKSCYDAVVSGTQMLIDKGIATPGKIGLQGHSWSGFQTAYLVTKTNMFACANIGAPIVDMVTGYLSIRNGSGMPRMFMYEETQSRMGKTLWEAKDKYLANSPLLDADKIETPLLIYHCDADEAVPYEQGRALYLAMRRLRKPAWLLNYKNEGHFLSGEGAQRDWTIRMTQFFDYYLKETKEPRWMKEGININERGIDQKYDLIQ